MNVPNNENDITLFQEDIDVINMWCMANKLTINIKKTKYMYFSQHNIRYHPSVKIDVQTIELTRTYTYLGVVLGSQSTFNPYINQVRKTASYKLKLLERFVAC